MTKEVDKASPNIFLNCVTGKHHPKATIVARKAGEKAHEYLKITLEEVFISDYQLKAKKDGETPVESFSLNFASVRSTRCRTPTQRRRGEQEEVRPQETQGGVTTAGRRPAFDRRLVSPAAGDALQARPTAMLACGRVRKRSGRRAFATGRQGVTAAISRELTAIA